jgi:hypothetical protein
LPKIIFLNQKKDYAMKLLLFFAFCFLSVCAFAQFKNSYPRLNPGILKRFKAGTDSLQRQFIIISWQWRYKLLSNISGNIAILPQDRMPCLLPDAGSTPGNGVNN